MNETWDAERQALTLLDSLHTCTLATVDEDGQAHAASLLYACDRFRLYWFSDPASRHSRHVDTAPAARVVVTVAGDHADFRDIRGLQMVGHAERLTHPLEQSAALERLSGRYGFLTQPAGADGKLAMAVRKAAIYRFTAEQVTLIDNRRGFGTKATFIPARAAHPA